ncbi:DUF3467 domain-containing protein [Myxococcota bacterium]|nr:DUF3467 domain-containing protein [Myxococcota bacterium]MBU1533692.1 DUF3467 domain-containing protein [Myxococcota bacterium]
MSESEKSNKFPFPIEIDEQTASGSYANIFMANHTENEFFMDFAFLGPGAKKVKVHSRVIITPKQMERFAMMVNESVRKYEESYGPITPKKPIIN